jgi:hypothetical protein
MRRERRSLKIYLVIILIMIGTDETHQLILRFEEKQDICMVSKHLCIDFLLVA